MNPNTIAVCTTTFYPHWVPGEADIQELLKSGDRANAESKIRGDLALETAQAVLKKGYRLVLVDGARESAFQKALREQGIPFVQETERGMSASRRQAFDIAYGDPKIQAVVWLEPEKVGMVEEIGRCANPVLNGEAAIVIPGRTEAGWVSLPPYQCDSEQKGNRAFNNMLHRAGLFPADEELDMYFGPRVYSATQSCRDQLFIILRRQYSFEKNSKVPLHAVVNPGSYSEATFFPPVAALQEGLVVQSVPTDFVYPEQQRVLEEHPPFVEGPHGYRIKRRAQLIGILTELLNYLRLNGKMPGKSRLSRYSDTDSQ